VQPIEAFDYQHLPAAELGDLDVRGLEAKESQQGQAVEFVFDAVGQVNGAAGALDRPNLRFENVGSRRPTVGYAITNNGAIYVKPYKLDLCAITYDHRICASAYGCTGRRVPGIIALQGYPAPYFLPPGSSCSPLECTDTPISWYIAPAVSPRCLAKQGSQADEADR
jgi:hypothetical protein